MTPSTAPSSGRDSSFRLLAVVGMVLLGTALTVKAFLESDSVVQAATQESVEPHAPQYIPDLELYRTTTFLWGGAGLGAPRSEVSTASGGLGLRRVSRSGVQGAARG